MKNTEKMMLTALEFASDALRSLCEHPAFADDAPEFNEGGVGYMASDMVNEAIRIAKAEDIKEQDSFRLLAPHVGLKADDFGKIFKFRKRSYRIAGIRPTSPRYPILGSRVPDGKTFKFPVDAVVRGLGA